MEQPDLRVDEEMRQILVATTKEGGTIWYHAVKRGADSFKGSLYTGEGHHLISKVKLQEEGTVLDKGLELPRPGCNKTMDYASFYVRWQDVFSVDDEVKHTKKASLKTSTGTKRKRLNASSPSAPERPHKRKRTPPQEASDAGLKPAQQGKQPLSMEDALALWEQGKKMSSDDLSLVVRALHALKGITVDVKVVQGALEDASSVNDANEVSPYDTPTWAMVMEPLRENLSPGLNPVLKELRQLWGGWGLEAEDVRLRPGHRSNVLDEIYSIWNNFWIRLE